MTLYKDGELSSVKNYDWEEPIEGTEDFVQVLEGGEWDYSWDIFKAWYSPGQRKYFWHNHSGCSCNEFGWDVNNLGDLNVGDKGDLERALREWGNERGGLKARAEYAIEELRAFKPVVA